MIRPVLLCLTLMAATALAQQPDPQLVRQIQLALNHAGYATLNPDGNWSASTSQALQRFQRAHGLEPTGQPDPRTLAALGVRERPATGLD